jgi:hypothetical protein
MDRDEVAKHLGNCCGWCGEERAAERRLADGEFVCAQCWPEVRRLTRGFPDCAVCKHRYWLMRLDAWGFRCLGCGLKFPGHVADEEQEERWPPYRHPFVDHTGRG